MKASEIVDRMPVKIMVGNPTVPYARVVRNHLHAPEGRFAVWPRGASTPMFLAPEQIEPISADTYTDEITDENGDKYVTPAWELYPRYYVGCAFCQQQKDQQGTFFPSHIASSLCWSGGRNHCTCDTCF